MLAELVTPASRTSVFAWYNFVGYLATALGSAEAGKTVDILQHSWHWTIVTSCHAVFVQYIIVALLMIVIVSSVMLQQRASSQRNQQLEGSEPLLRPSDNCGGSARSEPSNSDQASINQAAQDEHVTLGLSSKSMRVLAHLGLLFALDSFAGGLVTGAQDAAQLQLMCPCCMQDACSLEICA